MHIGLVGSGPAAEAARAAFADIDASVAETAVADLDDVDLGVVVATAGAERFAQANEHADRWVAVEVGGLGGHPIDGVDAGVSAFTAESGCYRCLRARVASNLEAAADRPRGDRSAVRLAGAVAGRRAIRLLSGDPLGGTVVEVPGPEREFLPVPGCDCGDAPERALQLAHRDVDVDDSLARAERGLDERLGLVRQVGERESFPVPYYLAQTADTSVFSDARAAEFAAGVDPDWDRAFMKALGEGLERYSAGVYRARQFTTAPEANLARAVSPRRFVRPDGFGVPDPETPTQWVEGVDLATDEEALLPAEYVQFPPPGEESTRSKPPITTGLGLGNSTVEAVLSGLYEVVERDATMLAWYSTFDPLGLAVDDDDVFDELVGRARAENLTVTPLLVTQDVDVPVVAVAVHRDDEWPQFAMGSGADLDATVAARSALAEALQNWMELRSMGAERAAAEEGAIGEYADFPAAARRFVDVGTTLRAADVGEVGEALSGTAELRAVVDRVADAGLDAYAARLTPRDVAELGFEAVRVLSPQAQPLFTGDPFFGDRARTVPESMGFDPRLDRPYHPYP
ncbi:ribosomal protein S12 methylthiotransferase accessory factor [Halogranum amylolyticum]|uniref:Ribosomal protein S12 methylthiotransferase accessory factor n=1 Tax=Halogranum amylolyticum TaxID=660520 RepID=A0A1H8S263_9EURY|nr:YcaO-like family protein [Halogranum amylolyticum]SEO72771.1 ribosomal protein S12 methylthiotransferase accessory factor [Halogranum amylolyticum]